MMSPVRLAILAFGGLVLSNVLFLLVLARRFVPRYGGRLGFAAQLVALSAVGAGLLVIALWSSAPTGTLLVTMAALVGLERALAYLLRRRRQKAAAS